MATISFTDAEGAGSISNLKALPGDRFADWTPDAYPIGPSVVGLGTGLTYVYEFRTDYLVKFEVRGIPTSELAKLLRLELHLQRGDPVTLSNDDTMFETYATSWLAPDTEPEISFTDNTFLEYTFAVTLRGVGPEVLGVSSQPLPIS